MPQHESFEVRSEEVQDILGRVPTWITRNGIMLVFGIVFLLVLGSWFFKYPDIIYSSIVVTSENPPAKLVARVDGKITEIYVEDKALVEVDQLIALIENPANYDDVVDLKKHLKWLGAFFIDFDLSKKTNFGTKYALGEIQVEYTRFLRSYQDYLNFESRDYYQKRMASIRQQISVYRLYYDRQWARRSVLNQELDLVLSRFNRDSLLYNKGVLSLSEFEKSKQAVLNKKYDFEGVRTTLAETQMKIIELDQGIIDLNNQSEEEKKRLQLTLNEAYNNLLGAIDVWSLNYLIKAPVRGEITFTSFWSRNQNVKRGEKVFTIIPQEPSRILGKVEMPIVGSGKVHEGQRVNIKFDNYPYMEYGIVQGVVNKISKVPADNYYALEVKLPNGLISNYGIELEFNHEISGSAEIITEDVRLLQRLFNPIRSLFSERVSD